LELAAGSTHDTHACALFFEQVRGQWVLADKAFDTDKVRRELASRGVHGLHPAKGKSQNTVLL
jgi:hypothetical protein